MATAPPGWYPDPSGQSSWRWWDGRQWSAHLHPPAMPAVAVPHYRPHPSEQLVRARTDSERLWTWARVSVWAYAAAQLGAIVIFLSVAGTFRHQVRQLLHEAVNNLPTQDTANNLSTSWTGWLYLPDLVIVPAAVLFLMWQYRVARLARLLGYPARISPALGVGAWFIPIADLWLPYWSLRDCLPPEHPDRRFGLWAWLSFIGAGLLGAAAETVSFFSVPWAVLPLVAAAACWIVAASLGTRLIGAIRSDQARAVAARVPS